MASLPYLSPDATPSPAGTLRRTAALMRERAEASGRGWGQRTWFGPDAAATIRHASPAFRAADAEHIASWHPDVALATADLLDMAAQLSELNIDYLPMTAQALVVAHAYLEGTS